MRLLHWDLLSSRLFSLQTATTKLHPGDKTEYRPLQRMALVVRQRMHCSVLFYIVLCCSVLVTIGFDESPSQSNSNDKRMI